MINKMNKAPVIVQQMVETLLNEKENPNTRFNARQNLDNISELCKDAITIYDKKNK